MGIALNVEKHFQANGAFLQITSSVEPHEQMRSAVEERKRNWRNVIGALGISAALPWNNFIKEIPL